MAHELQKVSKNLEQFVQELCSHLKKIDQMQGTFLDAREKTDRQNIYRRISDSLNKFSNEIEPVLEQLKKLEPNHNPMTVK